MQFWIVCFEYYPEQILLSCCFGLFFKNIRGSAHLLQDFKKTRNKLTNSEKQVSEKIQNPKLHKYRSNDRDLI